MSIQTKSLGAKASLSVLGFSAQSWWFGARAFASGDRSHRRGEVAVAAATSQKPSIAS